MPREGEEWRTMLSREKKRVERYYGKERRDTDDALQRTKGRRAKRGRRDFEERTGG